MSADQSQLPESLSGVLKKGTDLLFRKLAEPFPEAELKWKPQVVKGDRALALPYIDARHVMDRLDDVVGPFDWEDSYTLLEGGSVQCKLRVRVGERWVEKEDVGSPSEQPDGGDRLKAAFSDAFKRAAVKFGVGRYLYRTGAVWWDFDPVKKQFKSVPRLGQSAAPTKSTAQEGTKTTNGKPAQGSEAVGVRMYKRLREIEAELVKAGKCKRDELLEHIRGHGVKAGYPADFGKWEGAAIELAKSLVTAFGKSKGANQVSEQEQAQAANKPGVPRVTQSQADEIYTLLKNTGADIPGFLRFFDVPRIEDLPSSQFEKSKEILLRWAPDRRR